MPLIEERAWAPGPALPTLGEDAVHVWRVDLTTVTDGVAELLCGEERERGERLLNGRDGQLWMRSRGVLRVLLGRYLQQDPGALRFSTGAHGKPELRPQGLSFNLAHSDRLALYAIAQTVAVGVDVEMARRPRQRGRGGRAQLRPCRGAPAGRPRSGRPRAGVPAPVGATRGPAEVPGHGHRCGAPLRRARRELWIAELDVGAVAAAAVAADAPPRELCTWDWRSKRSPGEVASVACRLKDLDGDLPADGLAAHHRGERR